MRVACAIADFGFTIADSSSSVTILLDTGLLVLTDTRLKQKIYMFRGISL
jgi:hypothetical protein